MARVNVSLVNNMLDINIWEVPSFRAEIAIDFDEFGNILKVEILNKKDKSNGSD